MPSADDVAGSEVVGLIGEAWRVSWLMGWSGRKRLTARLAKGGSFEGDGVADDEGSGGNGDGGSGR